jgi:hypothetical protein
VPLSSHNRNERVVYLSPFLLSWPNCTGNQRPHRPINRGYFQRIRIQRLRVNHERDNFINIHRGHIMTLTNKHVERRICYNKSSHVPIQYFTLHSAVNLAMVIVAVEGVHREEAGHPASRWSESGCFPMQADL